MNASGGAGPEPQVRQLQQRAAELRAMARQLAMLAREYEDRAMAAGGNPIVFQRGSVLAAATLPDNVLLEAARRAYAARRLRDKVLGKALFGEPAWDMLLDLFIHAIKEGKGVSTTSLCIASAAPPTTALRWIGQIEKAGLIERHAVQSDRRVQVQELSRKGLDLMAGYFSQVETGEQALSLSGGAADGSRKAPAQGLDDG